MFFWSYKPIGVILFVLDDVRLDPAPALINDSAAALYIVSAGLDGVSDLELLSLSLLEYTGLGAENTADSPFLSALDELLGRVPNPVGRNLGREDLLGL